MPSPALSVVVPTHGRPSELARCLDLLTRQTCVDRIEVVVADDGGTVPDGLVERFAGPLDVRLLRLPHRGAAAARNAGADAARAPLLAFLDDDCLPAPGWAAALLGRAAAEPGVGIGGRTANGRPGCAFAVASQVVLDAWHETANPDPTDARALASCNLALPVDGFATIGGFDTSYRHAEDRDLCDRWRASGRRLVIEPAALALHARPLGLAAFLRQHYAYGRGARQFHEARRPGGLATPPAGFHRAVCARLGALPADVGWRRAGEVAALLALWRPVELAGYLAGPG